MAWKIGRSSLDMPDAVEPIGDLLRQLLALRGARNLGDDLLQHRNRHADRARERFTLRHDAHVVDPGQHRGFPETDVLEPAAGTPWSGSRLGRLSLRRTKTQPARCVTPYVTPRITS